MADDKLDLLDYYTLLGVDEHAPGDRIQAAYHAFARKYHPDRFAGAEPDKRTRAAQIFRRGAEGYKVLLDPQKRRRYDALLREGKLRYEPEAQAPPGTRTTASGAKIGPLPAKARPFAQKAREALAKGELGAAKLNLQIALGHAPEHPELLELKAQLTK